ncbi:unnamed protein product [Mycena citricolor]|uniref:Ras GEF n=1 Tax=Mycena citricolor TaxID=2018698 RepID=A0AAD2HT80_9AGAR|nr:unnamed protein product [Mycena citricolor]
MAVVQPHPLRQILHVDIDRSPYHLRTASYPNVSTSPSSSSARASIGTEETSPGNSSDGLIICSVLCMYDFESSDPDHLEFRKNELLDIVKQEDTGWWAAMRRGGDCVGWVPQAFVSPLTEEMAERLLNVREELRVYEWSAEQLYNAAPTVQNREWYDDSPASSPVLSTAHRVASPRKDHFPVSPGGRRPPPSPLTPMPQPPLHPLQPVSGQSFYKPTPPIPNDSESYAPSPSNGRIYRRQPIRADEDLAARLSVLIESAKDSPASPSEKQLKKLKDLTGSDQSWLDTPIAKATLPSYLLPVYSDQLKYDAEGAVRTGTLLGLVEKLASTPLTKDPIKLSHARQFEDVFLTTFRTFTTANQFFDLLVARFHMDQPDHLAEEEADEWIKKMQLPTQGRILTLFTTWLKDQRLLEEEPWIAQRLTDFLKQITQPPLASTAQLIIKTIEDLVSNICRRALLNTPEGLQGTQEPEATQVVPQDIAEQLTLLEFRLYAKVTIQECLHYAKTQSGKTVENLTNFCSTHDKLASWIKASILLNDQLKKRAETIDFWIKVAERCKALNNFASMSALINAAALDALVKSNDPSSGFSGYRTLFSNAEGPSIPFIGMYLTDIIHIMDQFSDSNGQISFVKRQRWFDVVHVMLKSQAKPYQIAENESTMNFIQDHLLSDSMRDQAWFWEKSQEVQKSELAHADIRKGLEHAGF